jgi:non-specific serine/threonine protein kinase
MGVAMDALAWVAVAQNQYERAARLFGAAQALLDRAGYNLPPFMAAGHDRAETMGRDRLGRRAWAAARERGRRLPHELAVAEARGEVVGRPVRPGGNLKVSRPGGKGGVLSQREWQVANLVAEGCTNRQIAERLGIGERTVTAHLEHIFLKLRMQTRAQVAVWVIEQGNMRSTAEANLAESAQQRAVLRIVRT